MTGKRSDLRSAGRPSDIEFCPECSLSEHVVARSEAALSVA